MILRTGPIDASEVHWVIKATGGDGQYREAQILVAPYLVLWMQTHDSHFSVFSRPRIISTPLSPEGKEGGYQDLRIPNKIKPGKQSGIRYWLTDEKPAFTYANRLADWLRSKRLKQVEQLVLKIHTKGRWYPGEIYANDLYRL